MYPSLQVCLAYACLIAGLGLLQPNSLAGQENVRAIDKPGSFNKYLTPASMDRWTFRGRQNETILVEVATSEFDAVVSLLRAEDDSRETLLHQADDDGSHCRLAFRLPADGDYKIGVTGFEQKGGGNYSFSIQKFLAREIPIDQIIKGEFDREGNAYFYFASTGDQYLSFDSLERIFPGQWNLLDPQGAPLVAWNNLYRLKMEGEFRVQLSGQRNRPFQFRLRSAVRDSLSDDVNWSRRLDAKQAAVLDYQGTEGDFRMIELTSEQRVWFKFEFAPGLKPEEQSLDIDAQRPELTFVSNFEKGKHQYEAVVLGRQDRYQLVLFAAEAGEIGARISDSRMKLNSDQPRQDRLPVGGTRFYELRPKAGQTTSFRLTTEEFDPVVQLFDDQGNALLLNDDEVGGGLNSFLRYTSYSDAPLMVAVKSVGNGGGGSYLMRAVAEAPQLLKLGDPQARNVGQSGNDLWLFSAQSGQQVIFFCKSSAPVHLALKNAQGILEGQEQSESESAGAVLLVKFPATGDYTIEVTTGAGDNYTLQAIAAD